MNRVWLPWFRFRWRPLLGTALVIALAQFLINVKCSADGVLFSLIGISFLVFLALFALVIFSIFIPSKKGPGILEIGSIALIYFVISFAMLRSSYQIRSLSQWLLHSGRYKAEVLALPEPSTEEFRHIEFDGWGFPGAGDTVVYLVFDPNDSLSASAKNGLPGKFRSIPCEVVRVRRLESHWYTVLFYTDTDWEHCS
jgi:hypothetical protein